MPDLNQDSTRDTSGKVRLRVVTVGTDGNQPCECTMTCRCETCIGDRVVALDRGPTGAGPAAFAVKPARLTRAA